MIFVISGPGGVGKGTVVARLMETMEGLSLSRSWTTRARRTGEPEGAYVFVSDTQFRERIAAGGFVEWTEFPATGRLYGTPTLDDLPGDVILEIELDGATQVKARHPEAVLILIVAPSTEEQARRLRGRGDDEAHVQRRLIFGEQEIELGRRIADHVVINDDVNRAAAEVAGIIRSRRGPA